MSAATAPPLGQGPPWPAPQTGDSGRDVCQTRIRKEKLDFRLGWFLDGGRCCVLLGRAWPVMGQEIGKLDFCMDFDFGVL